MILGGVVAAALLFEKLEYSKIRNLILDSKRYVVLGTTGRKNDSGVYKKGYG